MTSWKKTLQDVCCIAHAGYVWAWQQRRLFQQGAALLKLDPKPSPSALLAVRIKDKTGRSGVPTEFCPPAVQYGMYFIRRTLNRDA